MRGNEKPRESCNLAQGINGNELNNQYHTSKRPASTAFKFRPGKNDLNAVRKDPGADEPCAEYSVERQHASLKGQSALRASEVR